MSQCNEPFLFINSNFFTPRLITAIKLLAKIGISSASIYFVLKVVSIELVLNTIIGIQIEWLILALAVFLVAQLVSALRCIYIARVLGGNLGFGISIEAHFIGLWFNQVLPTGLGGDVIKVAMLKKNLGLNLAIRTAILDRVSGFVFLLLSIVMLLPAYGENNGVTH